MPFVPDPPQLQGKPTSSFTPDASSTPQESGGFGAKLLRSKAIPVGASIASSLIGSLVGPAGTIAGAGAGYGGGEVLRRGLASLAGVEGVNKPNNPAGNVLESTGGAVGASANAAIGVGIGKILGKFLPLLKGKGRIGKEMEALVAKAGVVPEEQLISKFGTTSSPNTKLLEGLTSAATSDKGNMQRALIEEIAGQGRSAGGVIPQPTYSDLLGFRKGAYSAGYEKTAPVALRELKKRIGGQYSDILKEGVPGLKKLDEAYSFLSKISGVKDTVFKQAPKAFGYYLLYKLLNGAGKAVSPE